MMPPIEPVTAPLGLEQVLLRFVSWRPWKLLPMRAPQRLLCLLVPSLACAASLPAQVAPAAGSNPATGRKPVTQRDVVVVHPLAYYEQPGVGPIGECLSARLEIGGAPAGRVRIGVYEPEVGGTTDVWRAATWSAALVAAQITDFDPRALQMSVEVRRSTDGPSAGALLAVGLIASIRGDTLREDATMTGTINPDGTIGPVGGIPMKIDGAAQVGKKLVVIPFGQDHEVDPRTGNSVNLVQYGLQRGIEIQPVRDIWAAYAALTGVTLPRSPGAELPELDDKFKSQVLERISRWIKLTRAAREKYDSWPEYTHEEWAENVMQQSRDSFDRVQEHLSSGDAIAAYMEATGGASYAWMAHEFGRYVYQLPTHGVSSLTALPQRHEWLVQEIDSTSAQMRDFQPRTFDQMARYLLAGLAYFEGLCAYEIAEDFKRLHESKYLQGMLAVEGNGDVSAGELRQAMFSIFAGVFQIVAWLDMKLATDYLELAKLSEGTPMPRQPTLVNVADFYRRGAEANMTIVNELALFPAARIQEMPVEIARSILPIGDGYMGTAHVGLTRVLPNLPKYLGEGEQLEYVRLAGALYLHSVTATLVAKYYSIGIVFGDDLTIASVNRPEALEDWIVVSRKQTESAIEQLISRNIDATTCLQLYWAGRVREQKTKPHERFEALQSYFYTHLMAQMLAQLAKTESGPEPPPQFETGVAPSGLPEAPRPSVAAPSVSPPPPPMPRDDNVPAPRASGTGRQPSALEPKAKK